MTAAKSAKLHMQIITNLFGPLSNQLLPILKMPPTDASSAKITAFFARSKVKAEDGASQPQSEPNKKRSIEGEGPEHSQIGRAHV